MVAVRHKIIIAASSILISAALASAQTELPENGTRAVKPDAVVDPDATEDAESAKMIAVATTAMTSANTVLVNCGPAGQQINISTGTAPVQWWSMGPGGPPVNATSIAPANVPAAWTATGALTGATWVQHATTTALAPAPNGLYYYQIKIIVGTSCNPAVHRVIIEGRAAGADTARARLIKVSGPSPFIGMTSGHPALPPQASGIWGYLASSIFSVFSNPQMPGPGTYILRFRVRHKAFNGSNAEALRFQGMITTT